MKFQAEEYPHRRYNPLLGEFVLVSPHRTKRPWQGKQEKPQRDDKPEYDPKCYLCPGNTRVNGEINPTYEQTYVFTNDFAALLPDVPKSEPYETSSLFHSESISGTCRVICFSPKHNLTLPEMQTESIRKVVDLWSEQLSELGSSYEWVQIFENKGTAMGSSNPHPHGQIWASNTLPSEIIKEDTNQQLYANGHDTPLLIDYAQQETTKNKRIIVQNEDWLVVVPFWAVWPFETLLLPKIHTLRLTDLTSNQRNSLSEILKRLLTKYDNLFQTSFPYSMGWHGAPTGKYLTEDMSHWQLHAHFYPPLLRSATVKKFMVGYEMMAEAQRDITAEQAATRLFELSETHYKEG